MIWKLAGLLLMAGLMIGGCSNSTNSELSEVSALDEFDSFKPVDEEPYFGDPIIGEVAAPIEEAAYNDTLSSLTWVSGNGDRIPPDVYTMRVVWGNLEGDSGITELTDWSGKLTVGRGGIIVTHTIRFEEGQDYILPRCDLNSTPMPQELEWVSKTSWHFDGLATKVIVPYSDTDELVLLHYESEQLDITFPVDQLEELDTMINIGAGNAISFQAMRHDPYEARRGCMAGRWGRNEDGQGVFFGRWISANGRIHGCIKGRWGVRTDDEGNSRQVFAGKFIDSNGKFRALVKGQWRVTVQDGRSLGEFKGRFYNADGEPIGIMRGHFKRGGTRQGGYFAGHWCFNCPHNQTDELVP
ncbi:MAG: hypothetical protein ABIE07_01880 [Candidatus Zixiibacteriota bacterium]